MVKSLYGHHPYFNFSLQLRCREIRDKKYGTAARCNLKHETSDLTNKKYPGLHFSSPGYFLGGEIFKELYLMTAQNIENTCF